MSLTLEKIVIPSADLGGFSTLPSVSMNPLAENDEGDRYLPEENENFFFNYGAEHCAFPYRQQNQYDRALNPTAYDSVVLENAYLRATFIPAFGGKLWSLVDKKRDRELLFKNSVVRPGNLGLTNAWMSGGIEWNCGILGHHPFTCLPIHTALTELEDGTPVLRCYYYERIRCTTAQLDFFLPEDSEFLMVRVRLENGNDTVTPTYWWSNIGVVEKEGDRVVVPATRAYGVFPNGKLGLDKIPVDKTYPANNTMAHDFFWDIPDREVPYVCQLDKEGYGLCETSTSLLRGRKLFIWGNSQGGKKWRNFLSADNESGDYDEIQCGIAHAQYESQPMPPRGVWEWIEAYGAMQADPEKVHGSWEEARAEVGAILDRRIPQSALEELLVRTRPMAKSPAKEQLIVTDGWGALENIRRGKKNKRAVAPHLNLGEIGAEQQPWLNLLENGTIGTYDPAEPPVSYMKQVEWRKLLEQAVRDQDRDNWYAHYMLGTMYLSDREHERSIAALERSLELTPNMWAQYALGMNYRAMGDKDKEIDCLMQAVELCPDSVDLMKDLFRALHEKERSDTLIALFESAPAPIRDNPRCQMLYCYALAREGRVDEAEAVLCPNGKYLIVPDMREGEIATAELWYLIQEKRGIPRTPDLVPPYDLDFRMHAQFNEDEWKE